MTAEKMHERNKALFRDIWNLLDAAVLSKKRHWPDTVKGVQKISKKFRDCEFAEALLMAVLGELERARKAGDLPW